MNVQPYRPGDATKLIAFHKQARLAAETETHKAKRLRAEGFACRWLADANEAEERGAVKTAEKCMEKAQYWLDRLNELEGYNDVGTPPRKSPHERLLIEKGN